MIEVIGIIGAVFVLAIAFQIFKAANLIGIVIKKGQGDIPADNNTSALLMLVFLVLFIGGFWWYFFHASSELLPVSASTHGDDTDHLFKIALGVILVPFTLINAFLFYAAYRFRHKKGRFASFYPSNNKLEVIWTIVPGLTFSILIMMGTQVWNRVTATAPEDAEVVNIMGYQFAWGGTLPWG